METKVTDNLKNKCVFVLIKLTFNRNWLCCTR